MPIWCVCVCVCVERESSKGFGAAGSIRHKRACCIHVCLNASNHMYTCIHIHTYTTILLKCDTHSSGSLLVVLQELHGPRFGCSSDCHRPRVRKERIQSIESFSALAFTCISVRTVKLKILHICAASCDHSHTCLNCYS